MPTLSDVILQQDIDSVRYYLSRGGQVNYIDEYGYTPLIEAAIVDNLPLCRLLLENGALPNLKDVTGGTPLQWAAENNNMLLAELLLQYHADPNAYNFAGQPVLVMPILRRHNKFRQLLVKANANLLFAQDYINTKLLGHMFELVGTANIISPQNQFVEVDFEGFYLEVTLGLVADSLSHFKNHFAARQLRRYSGIAQLIADALFRSLDLIHYQQYRIDITQHEKHIHQLIQQEPLIIPVGYEGHAITFIRYGDIWVKCDRREDSRLYDNVMIYKMTRPEKLTVSFIKDLIYKKQGYLFINEELDHILGLKPITELKVEAQISGNCSWANVEATIPALFFLTLMQFNKNQEGVGYYKTLALNFFHRWREWNKDRALDFCIQSYHEGDVIRKACKAEILAAILFQYSEAKNANDAKRIDRILSLLVGSPYEYILKNYVRIYYYESGTQEGRRFTELLKERGVKL